MRTQPENTEQKPKSTEIKNINAVQRMQLEQILGYCFQAIAIFPFDSTSETHTTGIVDEAGIADKSKALASFRIILVENLLEHQKHALKSWGILDAVEMIRKILSHPNPHGISSGVAGGLLNLVKYNDKKDEKDRTPDITKEAVVKYIQLEIERRIDYLLAQGVEPASFSKSDLRSQIGKIDDKELKEIFFKNIGACKKLIDATHISLD